MKWRMEDVPIQKVRISEANARKGITEEGLDELARSIEKHGLLQPVVVFKEKDGYSLIIGQRRFLACKDKLGWNQITARIMEVEDQIEAAILSFTENLHRLDLDYKDKMNVATRLLGSLGTVKKVAGELGVSEPTVRNYLGYAAVPDEVKELVDRKKLSTRTALEICRQIQDREMAIAVAKKVSESPRREKPRQHLLIAAARENPGKKLAEVERIASKQQYAKVTIHLTPRVAAALEGASKEMDVDPPLLATHAVEEWLTRRGFLS